MASKIDSPRFSAFECSGASYNYQINYVRLLAKAVYKSYKINPKLFEHGQRLHDFVEMIVKNGRQHVMTNAKIYAAVGAVAAILVLSYYAVQLHDLYNSASELDSVVREYKFKLQSLDENELKPTLEYINKTLLPNFDKGDSDAFCKAAKQVRGMLKKQMSRLVQLRNEIRSSECNARSLCVKAQNLQLGASLGAFGSTLLAFVVPHIGVPLCIGFCVAAASTIAVAKVTSVEETAFRLNQLGNTADILLDSATTTRSQINLILERM